MSFFGLITSEPRAIELVDNTIRVCDFPAATRIKVRIDIGSVFYLIPGHEGLFVTSVVLAEVRARIDDEIRWFRRDREAERGVSTLFEALQSTKEKQCELRLPAS